MSKETNKESEGLSIEGFLRFILARAYKSEKAPLQVGDRVTLDENFLISYFVPEGSVNPLGKDFTMPNEHLLEYFSKAEGIVIAVDLEFKFNCGHCDNTHTHDMLVNYPELGVSYYAKAKEFSVV